MDQIVVKSVCLDKKYRGRYAAWHSAKHINPDATRARPPVAAAIPELELDSSIIKQTAVIFRGKGNNPMIKEY
jgi:hypothetical protein